MKALSIKVMATYDIAMVEGIDIKKIFSQDNVENITTTLGLTRKLKQHKTNKYTVVKYIKQELSDERIRTRGLFRSIISKDDKVVVFAPPKGLKYEDFSKVYPLNDCIVEEYIEGTMINLFFDGDWEIATRSNVGGNYNFLSRNHEFTFRRMFLEACNETGLEFDSLDKELCYCFVLQHPQNRIVVQFDKPTLYLVSCYKIDNQQLKVDYIDPVTQSTCVPLARKYNFDTFEDIQQYYTVKEQSYLGVGLMIHHIPTGTRTKVRNPAYEHVRRLRGNQSNDLYRYLELRFNGLVTDYLVFYSEETESFHRYRKRVERFTGALYNCYVETFIKKKQNIIDLPLVMQSHVYKLHNHYRDVLRDKGKIITKHEVINYVNNIPPWQLYSTLKTN